MSPLYPEVLPSEEVKQEVPVQKTRESRLSGRDIILLSSWGLWLGTLYYLLVDNFSIGLGLLIFAAIFVGGFVFHMLFFKKKITRETAGLLVFFLLFAFMNSMHVGAKLVALNTLGMLATFSLLIVENSVGQLRLFTLPRYILSPIMSAWSAIWGLREYIWDIIASGKTMKTENTVHVIFGIIIALPILFIFLVLLGSADAAFWQVLRNIFEISFFQNIVQHIVTIGIYSAIFLGVFSCIIGKIPESKTENPTIPEEKRHIETHIVLVAIIVLFAIFIGFQIRYLFGGQSMISISGYTYAEYARKGFEQLMVVSALVFAILWTADWHLYNHAVRPSSRAFRVVSSILIGLTWIILISAVYRLSMYQQAYGFTEIRFYSYAAAVIIALSLLAILIRTYVFIREWVFIAMILTLLFSSVIVFDIVNPESFIVKENRTHATISGRSFDFSYAGSSSLDATEALVQLYQSSNPDKQEEMRSDLCQMLRKTEAPYTWQEWNYSIFRAKEALFPLKFQLGCHTTEKEFSYK